MTRFLVKPDDDRVTGTSDRDQISGLEGNDILDGAGPGSDRLFGNQGNDILSGGSGQDNLIGGAGGDIFILGQGQSNFRNADLIADFRQGQDLIDLRNSLEFADLELLGNNNTFLRDRLTGEFLAIIAGVSPEEITSEDFTTDFAPPTGGLDAIASIELSGAEIIAHDSTTQRLFVVTGDEFLEIIDIADPTNPIQVDSINLRPFTANSVAANNGMIAVAIENTVAQDPGLVGFFDGEGEFFGAVTVGALPDMITFTPDGQKVLVANEGEPKDDYTVRFV